VFTTRASRGKIASAFTMDVHIDDRLENAVDIASDSRTWSILVWRDEASFEHIDINARKLGIAVVRTVNEALDKMVAASRADAASAEPGAASDAGATASTSFVGRLRRAFHKH
jgi:hypothetical protein